jgi:hypothetical protein
MMAFIEFQTSAGISFEALDRLLGEVRAIDSAGREAG